MSGTSLPDVVQGEQEPEGSSVVLALVGVGAVGLLAMFTLVFGWDSFPLLGELLPFFDTLGSGGIWYYILGIMIASAMLFVNMVGEVLGD